MGCGALFPCFLIKRFRTDASSSRTDEFCKAATHLTDHLLPERERTIATRTLLDGAREAAATARYQTPFNLAFRTELGYFQWLELPENTRRMTNFGRAMVAARAWEVAENIIDGQHERIYPCLGIEVV